MIFFISEGNISHSSVLLNGEVSQDVCARYKYRHTNCFSETAARGRRSATSSAHLRRWHQGEMHTFYMKTFSGFLGSYCEMQLKRKRFKCWDESCKMYVRVWCMYLQKRNNSLRWWEDSCKTNTLYKRRGWREPLLQKVWKWAYFTNMDVGSLCWVSKINWFIIIMTFL